MAVSAAPGDDFRQKLILSIVDKLVFGLLIVLAGFVLNLVLENHRADQAVKTEIARLRVEKVAAVWQALDRHQRAIDSLGQYAIQHTSDNLASQTEASRANSERIEQRRFAAMNREYDKLTALIETNRFWIGEQLYPKYRNYASQQRDLFAAYFTLTFGLNHEITKWFAARLSPPTPTAPTLQELLAKLRTMRHQGMQNIKQRRSAVNESRTDVFSAMEQLG